MTKHYFRDLVGQRFGRLIAIQMAGKSNSNQTTWLCRCDCGNEVVIVGSSLTRGSTKSCGCFNKDVLRDRSTGENHHNWNGGKTKHRGYTAVICKGHPRADRDGYVPEHLLVAERVLGEYIPKEHVVHHINGIKTDNRLENLWWFPSHSGHMKHHNALRHEIEPTPDVLRALGMEGK